MLRCVIQPYQEFPTLLELLLSFLKTEQLVTIRRETLRVLGLLGALDPYKHKMNLGHVDIQVLFHHRTKYNDNWNRTDFDFDLN